MDDAGPAVTSSILIFFALFLGNFLLIGFESALRGLSEGEIERRAKEEKDCKSIRLSLIMEKRMEFAVCTQMLLNVGYCALGAVFIHDRYDILLLAAGILLLSAVAVYIPSRLALKHPEHWAYVMVHPVYVLWKILLPFYMFAVYIGKLLLFVLRIKEVPPNDDVTEEEIIDLVNEGHEHGIIEASEAEMITNIIEFGDKEAQDIMVHRGQIVALDGDMHFKEAIDFILAGHNSRFPVYQESLDHIIGILHLKDAMRIHNRNELFDQPIRKVRGLLRKPVFIPQTRNVGDLFRRMQAEKVWIAIALDEYGQTTGLLTMEDILEEIVGNIQDEYDKEETHIREKGKGEYVIHGLTPLEELEERFGIRFGQNDFETLNGFLVFKMDRIPEENEQFDVTVEGYNFKILSVKGKVIDTVLVTKVEEDTESLEEKGE